MNMQPVGCALVGSSSRLLSGSSASCASSGSNSQEQAAQFFCSRPLHPNDANISSSCSSLFEVAKTARKHRLCVERRTAGDLARVGLRGRGSRNILPRDGHWRAEGRDIRGKAAAATENGVLWHWSTVAPAGVEQDQLGREGPSCLYVGPVESAAMDDLEALYQQARDEYYNGRPLILDEMFDKVERRLRWFGSKLVLKYPRCSLKRYSAYSDAELDQAQLVALSTLWSAILVGGISLAIAPPVAVANGLLQNSMLAGHGHEWDMAFTALSSTMTVNATLFTAMAVALGVTVATAAARSLSGLHNGGLVALKGSCPACGEEVYAFIRADESVKPRHKCECHVCEHPLVFHANLEASAAHPNRLWAWGRIYLVVRAADLSPAKSSVADST